MSDAQDRSEIAAPVIVGQCVNCGHDDHHGERCDGLADDEFCACSWPDPSEIAAHQCDDGCNVGYCLDCGEDYTDPCERHRSFGHVRSFDPYGDDVDCQDCCPICGSGTPSPAALAAVDAPHPRGVTDVTWDNLGEGWRMTCSCGFVTIPCPHLVDAADEMESHWEAVQ